MDIKIGFNENPRELVIAAGDKRDEAVAALREGLNSREGFIEIEDAKGQVYLVNAEEISYVEIGATDRPAVGFGGV